MLKKETGPLSIVWLILLCSASVLNPLLAQGGAWLDPRLAIRDLPSAAVSFIARKNFEVDSPPWSVAVGDFDGDKIQDLVVSASYNSVSGTLFIFFGNGDGTFRAARIPELIHGPGLIAVGDLNGDEILDLIILQGGLRIAILTGNGDGTFQFIQSLGVARPAQALVIGDFNGDGVPDLAVPNGGISLDIQPPPRGNVSIFLGKGDGTFVFTQNYEVGVNPTSIALADFNGDKVQDLAVANYGMRYYTGTTVSILLGNGDGTFQSPQNVAVGNWPGSLAVGDFNGDGFEDLIVSNGAFLLGNGDGTFRRAPDLEIRGSSRVGDFNGDGRPDLIASDGSVWLGNGDGTFRRVSELGIGGAFRLGDFNGDGIQDLVMPSAPNTVSIFLGNGDGTFQNTPYFRTRENPGSIVAGDFNKDGLQDLAVANGSHTVSIFLGTGEGRFQAAGDFEVRTGPHSVALGDFNNDEVQDLAVANTGTNGAGRAVSILLGNGDGTFRPARDVEVGKGPIAIAVGDLNGDEVQDLAVANNGISRTGTTASILLGNGDGTFRAVQDVQVGVGPVAVILVDLNGDGVLDLVTVNESSHNVSILLGNGDGTFQAARNFGVGVYPQFVTAGDFDGDNIPDLAVANTSSDSVAILIGNGDGTIRSARNFWAGNAPRSIAVGDFDGDNRQDLAVTQAGILPGTGTTVAILAGRGDGTFGPPQYFGVGLDPLSITLGDFDGDGRPDLAVANAGSITVSILINDTRRR